MRPTYNNRQLYNYKLWAIDNRDAVIAYAQELGLNDLEDILSFLESQYRTQVTIHKPSIQVNYGGQA